MWKRALRLIAASLVAPAFAALVNIADAQEADWRTFTRAELGLTMQRPADLYELDPESPAEDVKGEVEWGPKDHGWSIIVTSQKLKPGQTLASVVAEEQQRNPKAVATPTKIGDGVEAVRMWALDDDMLSSFVLLLDKTGTRLIAIELAILLDEDDAGKDLEALRSAHSGTLSMFERMLASVRIAKN